MQLTHRHFETIPYIGLTGLLIMLLWVQPSYAFFVLLLIPIAMAAVIHQLIGGSMAALIATAGMIAVLQTQSAGLPLLETWHIQVAYLTIGPGLGWLADRQRERERRAASAHNQALAAIHDAGREIAATRDLSRTLRLVMGKAAETFPMAAGILYQRDSDSQMFHVAVAHNLPPDKIESITIAFNEGVPGWVMLHQKPLIINKVEPEPSHPQYVLNVRGIGYRFTRPD